MRLVSIKVSPRAGKKWRATFDHDGTIFHTDFGASGYQDFTQHKDPERARLYRLRHEKDLKTNNPTKPGYLSYYILWSSPNFAKNVRDYKKMFNL